MGLIFPLLSFETAGPDHLRALSRFFRLLRDGEGWRILRRTANPAEPHAFLIEKFATPPA